MGQRPSMQQSEVVRRPRAGSELGSGTVQTNSTSGAAPRIHHHRTEHGTRARQPQNDTSSASSVSSASPMSAHSSRSSTEEGGAGGESASELARFFNQLGFVQIRSGSTRHRTSAEIQIGTSTSSTTTVASELAQSHQQNGDGVAPATSVPCTSSVRHGSSSLSSSNLHHRRTVGSDHHQRHNRQPRRFGGNGSGATVSSSSSSHQRVSRNRLRGDGTTDRLQALLNSLEAMANDSGDGPSSASSSQLTAVQINKLRRSVPLLQILGRDIKCPVCHKVVPSDDVEVHLVVCLSRPQLSYNDDILTMDKGECAICLEEMEQGTHIARLPCLCIYHKSCIDEWFKRKNTCPEHPGNDEEDD